MCREMDYLLGVALASYYLGRTAHLQGDLAEAERYLTESLAIAKKLAYQWGVTQSLNILGNVAFAQGKYQQAKRYLVEALEMTQEMHAAPMALDVLTGLAQLLAEEGENERAVALLTLPLRHAASKQETKEKASRLYSQLSSQLPSQIVDIARQNGHADELEVVVAQILRELNGHQLAVGVLN
jgi:tetratricopeptide (TPR) repeat protein